MNVYTIPQRVIIVPKFFQINLRIIRVLSLILISVLISSLFIYIFQVNLMTKEVYLIQNYQKKTKELSRENKSLEVNFSQQNSLSYLKVLVDNLNLEKASEIHYIKVLASQVVAK